MNAEDRSAFVVLGQTGHGKTVFLVHLIQAWLDGVAGAGRAELLPDSEEKRRRSLQAVEAFPAPGRRTTSQAVATITRAFEEGHGVEGTQEPEDFFVQWSSAELAPDQRRVVRLRDVPGYVFEEGERWEQRGERWGDFLDGALGAILVLDLGAALSAASESRFAALVHRYVHAVSAAEAAARRAGASALPVALVFSRADLEPHSVTQEHLRALPALRPLFAALDEKRRRIEASVHVVSCLRLAREDGAQDRAELEALIASFGRNLSRTLLERVHARRRRLVIGTALAALLIYGVYAAIAARSFSAAEEPAAAADLQATLDAIQQRERALRRYAVFPWWPGKDSAAVRAHIAALELRAAELLFEHPALREAEGRFDRTRAEYATALHALKRVRLNLGVGEKLELPPGPEPREALLRAKRELARLEAPSARNLHEWEALWAGIAFPALKDRVAAGLEGALLAELEALELASSKERLEEELADIGQLERFARAHAGLADALIARRLEREWDHVRFVLERARESGQGSAPAGGLLAPLTAIWSTGEPGAWIAREAAFEIGRCIVAGTSAAEREQLARELGAALHGEQLAAVLWSSVPRLYVVELLSWNGEEGRPYLTRAVSGFADLAHLLRGVAPSEAARRQIDAFDTHLARLDHGRIGPYRLWLRRLVADAGDELFWLRLPSVDAERRFQGWNELGGLAQPIVRCVRLGENLTPFTAGELVPGEQGWQPFTPRWEGRLALGEPFDHEAGRGLRIEIADRGTTEQPRPAWLAWIVHDAKGAFAPETLDGKKLEVVIDREAAGEAGARDPAQRFHPAARQVLQLWLEVQCAGQPLREASAAFDFRDWESAWSAER